jgi:hypothetical protein
MVDRASKDQVSKTRIAKRTRNRKRVSLIITIAILLKFTMV